MPRLLSIDKTNNRRLKCWNISLLWHRDGQNRWNMFEQIFLIVHFNLQDKELNDNFYSLKRQDLSDRNAASPKPFWENFHILPLRPREAPQQFRG